MPGSSVCYVERVSGRRNNIISLPPAQQSGVIKFGRVFLSFGAARNYDVNISIFSLDGTPRIRSIKYRIERGRRLIFELEGGSNPDAVAEVDMGRDPYPEDDISALVEAETIPVETDSPEAV